MHIANMGDKILPYDISYTSNSAEIKAFTSFSSRIAKFVLMLDVAMLQIAFRSRA